MKIIDAVWEKRNLGVRCKEVVIELKDSLHDIHEVLANADKTAYLVLKVPSGRIDIVQFLTNNGCQFTEGLCESSLDIENFTLPKEFLRFDEYITYKALNSYDLESLEHEIKKGIFKTDRIALDPHFGISVSANRYFNWIKDEVEKNDKDNCVYEVLYKEKPIGFFTLKSKGEKTFDNYLAGMYIDNPYFGLGFSVISKPIEEIRKKGGRYYTSRISFNNLPIVRLFAHFGFIPNDISYVMIKHFS